MEDRGILGEIFSSFQGEGPLIGQKQIFVRTAGCNLRCNYCDTSHFHCPVPTCRIECTPASGKFKEILNPMSSKEVLDQILCLVSPGLHSVSLTGGEPLCQSQFIEALATKCSAEGLRVYLETNGFSSVRFSRLIKCIDFAAVDLKLPSHQPCSDWRNLLENELACLKTASKEGLITIAKVVILNTTSSDEVVSICSRLDDPYLIVVLQPASGTLRPSTGKLMHIHQALSRHLEEVIVVPQSHKLMDML